MEAPPLSNSVHPRLVIDSAPGWSGSIIEMKSLFVCGHVAWD